VKSDNGCINDEKGFDRDKEEFFALYRQMHTPKHRETCRKLFDASADELNATYRPSDFVVTPAHIRAGLKWLFGRFFLAVEMSDNEAAVLLNSAPDKLVHLRSQLSDAEALKFPQEMVERLSLLLGIYGAIARIAPDGPSRFVHVAFREAPSAAYDGRTLIEYLIHSESLDSWYAVLSHLRSLEAEFLG